MFIFSFFLWFGLVKDIYQNLKDMGECVINIVLEDMIEVVSVFLIDVFYGVLEWDIIGLMEVLIMIVKLICVKEFIFFIEVKVVDIKEFEGYSIGMSKVVVCFFQVMCFWVREDVINEDFSYIDLDKLRFLG